MTIQLYQTASSQVIGFNVGDSNRPLTLQTLRQRSNSNLGNRLSTRKFAQIAEFQFCLPNDRRAKFDQRDWRRLRSYFPHSTTEKLWLPLRRTHRWAKRLQRPDPAPTAGKQICRPSMHPVSLGKQRRHPGRGLCLDWWQFESLFRQRKHRQVHFSTHAVER